MKKLYKGILTVVLACGVVLSLAGCGGSPSAKESGSSTSESAAAPARPAAAPARPAAAPARPTPYLVMIMLPI